MSRPTRRSCLATLTRARLWELVQEHDVGASSRDKRDELLDALVRARRISLEDVLASMNRNELKAVCRAHELDDGGVRKDAIRARVLDACGQTAKAPASESRQGELFTATPSASGRESKKKAPQPTTSAKSSAHATTEAPAATGQVITGNMKSRVDRLWTTFWSNGISNPLSVIEQVSYLLFIKRLDDLERAKERKARRLGRPIESPRFAADKQHLRWSHFKNLSDADELLRMVRDEVFPFIKSLGGDGDQNAYAQHMQDAVFLISNAALLENVIGQIEELPMENRDTKGDLYEYMLSKLTTAGTNGQFRTPRHIIEMMVKLVDPQPDDIICDPACGTAGFLVAASEHVRDRMLSKPAWHAHYNRDMFHGFDFDATMLRIGSMNMMLHGIRAPHIEARDSLSESHSGAKDAFTVVLANPPFKGSVEKSSIAKDLTRAVKTAKTELLFLALFLRLLKTGGRAAVIVPDGVLFGSSRAHKTVREELVEQHKLDGVISMPSGVFRPYAGVSTAILLFTKTGAGGTDKVWFYDMQADGLSLDDKRQPVADNDIPDILAQWTARTTEQPGDRKSRVFFVPKEEIVENEYNLSINRYKELIYEEVVYDPPEKILDRLDALEREIVADLKALRGTL